LLLAAAPGWAQITYTTGAGPSAAYVPLDGATVRGSIKVRITGCPAGPWAYTVDNVAMNVEGSCPFDLLGDAQFYDSHALADGAHTVTAKGPSPPTLSASFTVSNNATPVPPVPAWTGSSTVTWEAPTKNTDGSALANLSGFRIKYGASAAALDRAVTLSDPALRRYVLEGLGAGTWSIGMTAFTPTAESALSSLVSVTLTAPAPVCGAAPPVQSRSQTCPAPTVGNWTQVNAWTAALESSPAGTCWLADWQPASAPAGICAQPPPPPPTCPPKPVDATRLATCPAGTTGTFQQTRVSSCLSGVWVPAAAFTPLTPPAGSCPVTPPASAWKVGPSLALPVYEAVLAASGPLVVRGGQVGTIALGKPCGAQIFTELGRSFRTVTASDVQLTSPSYASRVLVAACQSAP
jgi:hypothetical protein